MSGKPLEALLREMCERNASDLLFSSGMPPQFRVNGFLEPVGAQVLDPEGIREIAWSVLGEDAARKLETEKNLDISRGFEGLSRFRMNLYYQKDSLAIAIRRIPLEIPSFEQLGLPPIARDLASLPHGLALITGPAGSGKSTTLAAMIDHINNNRHVHIVCVEDPIEYLHSHRLSVVEQREIGQDVRSFGEALRSVFRQSPDVIMVGEMRDAETMQLALSLAETGHLILATLHTQDTSHAINRIVDSFPPQQHNQIYAQLSLVLSGIISQQLIITKDRTRRVLACEVLNVNNAVRNLIREMQIQQIYSVVETGKSEGMMTMNESLVRLWRDNLISAEVAMNRSSRPKEMERMMRAK